MDEIGRLIFAGGKRIRPLFCYWGHRAAGGPHSEAILRASASLELLHAMALIHDDVMDLSSIRRGESTIHVQAALARREQTDVDASHFGISVAILAGDLAFILSDMLIATSGFTSEAIVAAAEPLGAMRLRAISGQYLDLYGSTAGLPDVEAARRIARLKTAAYTVEGPLLVGAALAGAGSSTRDALSRYGLALGEAFQHQDDLAGFDESPPSGSGSENDVRQGKITLALAETFARAHKDDRELVEAIWARPNATGEQIDTLREVVRRSGAEDAVLDTIRDLSSEAKESLEGLPASVLNPEVVPILNLLADQLLEPSGVVART